MALHRTTGTSLPYPGTHPRNTHIWSIPPIGGPQRESGCAKAVETLGAWSPAPQGRDTPVRRTSPPRSPWWHNGSVPDPAGPPARRHELSCSGHCRTLRMVAPQHRSCEGDAVPVCRSAAECAATRTSGPASTSCCRTGPPRGRRAHPRQLPHPPRRPDQVPARQGRPPDREDPQTPQRPDPWTKPGTLKTASRKPLPRMARSGPTPTTRSAATAKGSQNGTDRQEHSGGGCPWYVRSPLPARELRSVPLKPRGRTR